MSADNHGPELYSPERRARILAGASRIFIRDGYEGASMSQIAVAANVSKGTLYNYYPSKEALFAAFVKARCGHLLEAVFREAAGGDSGEEVAAALKRIGMTMLRLMVSPDSLAVYRVVVMESSKFPELAQVFMNAGPKVLVGRMADLLRRLTEAGRLRVADPLFAAEQFFALAQTRISLRARVDAEYRSSDAEIEFVVDGAVEVFLAAYANAR